MSRFDRQSFLGASSDQRLRELRVAIVGLGGGGSHIAQQLAHVGVGSFLLFDPDVVELSNLNRLVGASERDARSALSKVDVITRLIRAISPTAHVDEHQCNWQMDAEFLRGCDVVFGCVDTFIGRSELERAARRYQIPYIDIGMDVHDAGGAHSISGQVSLSMPDRPCLHCMGVLTPELMRREAQNYGSAGRRPQVIWPNGVLASTAVGLFMQLVTPWHSQAKQVQLLEYDGNSHELKQSTSMAFLMDKKCPHFSSAADLGDPWFDLS